VITINVRVNEGTALLAAAQETIALASRLNCHVDFVFEGKHCRAMPGGSPAAFAKAIGEGTSLRIIGSET
jgi:hypothetical protein